PTGRERRSRGDGPRRRHELESHAEEHDRRGGEERMPGRHAGEAREHRDGDGKTQGRLVATRPHQKSDMTRRRTLAIAPGVASYHAPPEARAIRRRVSSSALSP